MKTRRPAAMAVVLGLALLGGCASDPVTMAPRAPEKFERLGKAEGRACGAMLLGPAYLNFIPAKLNSRYERAYAEAVQSVPGSTALVNVTIQEDWFWWLLGNSRCITVTGEAIR